MSSLNRLLDGDLFHGGSSVAYPHRWDAVGCALGRVSDPHHLVCIGSVSGGAARLLDDLGQLLYG